MISSRFGTIRKITQKSHLMDGLACSRRFGTCTGCQRRRPDLIPSAQGYAMHGYWSASLAVSGGQVQFSSNQSSDIVRVTP